MLKKWQIGTFVVALFCFFSVFGAETAVTKEEQAICGTHPFLKNYCYYKLENGEWLICSERYGGCPTKEKSQKKSLFKLGDDVQKND